LVYFLELYTKIALAAMQNFACISAAFVINFLVCISDVEGKSTISFTIQRGLYLVQAGYGEDMGRPLRSCTREDWFDACPKVLPQSRRYRQ